jgi:hypothetical protein
MLGRVLLALANNVAFAMVQSTRMWVPFESAKLRTAQL